MFDTVACDFNTVPEVVYSVAPGEGQKPLSIFGDPQVGPLAFASVWGGGRVEESTNSSIAGRSSEGRNAE